MGCVVLNGLCCVMLCCAEWVVLCCVVLSGLCCVVLCYVEWVVLCGVELVVLYCVVLSAALLLNKRSVR